MQLPSGSPSLGRHTLGITSRPIRSLALGSCRGAAQRGCCPRSPSCSNLQLSQPFQPRYQSVNEWVSGRFQPPGFKSPRWTQSGTEMSYPRPDWRFVSKINVVVVFKPASSLYGASWHRMYYGACPSVTTRQKLLCRAGIEQREG